MFPLLPVGLLLILEIPNPSFELSRLKVVPNVSIPSTRTVWEFLSWPHKALVSVKHGGRDERLSETQPLTQNGFSVKARSFTYMVDRRHFQFMSVV